MFVGHAIALDATALADPQFSLYGITEMMSARTVQRVQVLPARYYLGQPAGIGPLTPFEVTADGKITFDASSDADVSPAGFLRGKGTSTIVFVGHAIALDARALSDPVVSVYGITELKPSDTVQEMRLLPARYSVGQPAGLAPAAPFEVTADGKVTFDASSDADVSPAGYLRGKGTSTIVVLGHTIFLDARALAEPRFALYGITDEGSTRVVLHVQLLPARYVVQPPSGVGPETPFLVSAAGKVDYDTSMQANPGLVLGGRLTSTLHLFPASTRSLAWTQAPLAEMLPDLWAALAFQGDQLRAIAVSKPVRHPLAVGPTPQAESSSDPLDGMPAVGAGLRWMTDFGDDGTNDPDSALNVGMALRMPLTDALAAGIDRLLVIGLRSSDGPESSATNLNALLDAHRYTSGLGIAPQDTPTNNTERENAHATVADAEGTYALELGAPLLAPGPMPAPEERRDGHWLAWGLGTTADAFGRIEFADGVDIQSARAALASWTPLADSALLRRLGLGASSGGAGMPDASAVGNLPVLRVGTQPYAILPVTSLRPWATEGGVPDSWVVRLRALADELRCREATAATFRASASIAELVSQSGAGCGYIYQSFADPNAPTGEAVDPDDLLDSRKPPPWHPWTAGASHAAERDAIDALTRRPDVWVSGLAAQRLRAIRDEMPTGLRIGAWGYVEDLLPAGRPTLSKVDVGMTGPIYELVTNKGFVQAPSLAHAATAAILRSGYDPDNPAKSATAVDLSSARVRRAKWLLDGIRQGQSLGNLLGYRVERRLQDAGLAAYIAKFRILAASREDGPVGEAITVLDEAERDLTKRQNETDDWNDADKVYQAALLTTAAAQNTIKGYNAVVAAECILTIGISDADVRLAEAVGLAGKHRRNRPRTVSSVLARKINSEIPDEVEIKPWNDEQARLDGEVTKIVSERDALARQLEAIGPEAARARFQTQIAEPPDPRYDGPAVKAKSEAVVAEDAAKKARGKLVDPHVKPTVSDREGIVETARSVLRDALLASWVQASSSSSVSRVVNGLDLYRRWQRAHRLDRGAPEWNAQTIPFGDPEFPDFPGPDSTAELAKDYNNLLAQFATLADEVDAVGDLTVAESVFQLVRGNPTRGGATLDILSDDGAAPPDDFEVVRTPRSSTAVSHRVLSVLPVDVPIGGRGWAATPGCIRAQLEPALESYAATLLPPPGRIVFMYQLESVDSGVIVSRGSLRASSLQLSALDFVALAAASVEFANGSRANELADRIAWLLFLRPNTPSLARLRLVPDPDAPLDAGDIALADAVEIAAAIHDLTSSGRGGDGRDIAKDAGYSAATIADLRIRTSFILDETMALQVRLDKARNELDASKGETQSAAVNAELLLACNWRIPGAMPPPPIGGPESGGAASLPSRIDAALGLAESVSAEIERRVALFKAVEVAPSIDGPKVLEQALAQARCLLGADVQLLPRIGTQGLQTWLLSIANSSALQDGDASAARSWLQQVAYVREGAARLQTVLTYAHAFDERAVDDLVVGQLPWAAGDRWAALPVVGGAGMPTGRTSTVLHCPQPVGPQTGELKLLFHDAWTELVPSAEEVTAVAFHHDQPGASAPNLALLAVAEPGRPWDLELITQTVLSAVDLATARAAPSDGRTELLWFDDDLPAGATEVGPVGPNDNWAWLYDNPSPPSGRRTHDDPFVPDWFNWSGHRFFGASPQSSMTIGPDETLFAYVYLHASQMPRSLMLSWSHSGSAQTHQAIWGLKWWSPEDWVGELPPRGAWVRLEVPARRVGLGIDGNVTIDGMGFNVLEGHATWGRVGKLTAAGSLQQSTTLRNDRVWFHSRLPAGAVPATFNEDAWHWTARDPEPYGAKGQSGASHWSAATAGLHGHEFTDATETLAPRFGDVLFAYVFLDVAYPPQYVVLQWTAGTDREHRAFWGAEAAPPGIDARALGTPALRRAADLPPTGRWIRLEVSCADVDLQDKKIDGMAFSVVDGSAAWGPAGLSALAISNELILP